MAQCFKCGRPCGTKHEHTPMKYQGWEAPPKEYYCDACWEKACEDQANTMKLVWKLALPILAIVALVRMPGFLLAVGFEPWQVFGARFIVGVLLMCYLCKKFTGKYHPAESIFIVGYLVASFWAFPKYLVPKIGLSEQAAWYCQLGSIGVLIVLLIVWGVIRKKKKA